jgi:UDP-N-acetylmuramate--alanine ligase
VILPDEDASSPASLGRVHLVGIGGSGMSGLAQYLAAEGFAVSGCDTEESAKVEYLRSIGIPVARHHLSSHAEDIDTLVITTALRPDNPDYRRARELGRTILHRAQALEWISKGKRVFAVAGSNGKTTTSGMLVRALETLGSAPSFVIGGVMLESHQSAGAGLGENFVIEADESDGSFQLYRPSAVLITGVDTDHSDFYGGVDRMRAAFEEFASHAQEFAVLSADDPVTRRLARSPALRSVVSFGRSSEADVQVTEIVAGPTVNFSLGFAGFLHRVTLQIPGAHNAINAR